MRRKQLKVLKSAMSDLQDYELENGKRLADDPTKLTEVMMRSFFRSSAHGGISFTPTVGSDDDFTLEKRGDLRPVVFSFLSNDDHRLYHCSALFANSEAVVRKRLQMNPFPVGEEAWQEMVKGDVLDAMIMTLFDFDGEGHSFRTQYVGIHAVTLLVTNILNPTRPPGFEDL